MIVLCAKNCFCVTVSGQGCRAQLCFNSMQLHDDDGFGSEKNCGHEEDQEDDMMNQCEPLTSHGMRPARGWALDLLPVSRGSRYSRNISQIAACNLMNLLIVSFPFHIFVFGECRMMKTRK